MASYMMTLPKLTNANPTTSELFAEQKRLQKQADKMLKETNLLGILERFGANQSIEGSYAYGLMVYPDLDLSVLADNITKQDFAKLVYELSAADWLRGLSTADRVNFASSHPDRIPKGFWLGLDVAYQGDRWGIDIWLQQPDWLSSNPGSYAERLTKLNEKQRAAVLEIKYHLIYDGLYGNKFFSGDVYDAVLDRGITSFEGFKRQS